MGANGRSSYTQLRQTNTHQIAEVANDHSAGQIVNWPVTWSLTAKPVSAGQQTMNPQTKLIAGIWIESLETASSNAGRGIGVFPKGKAPRACAIILAVYGIVAVPPLQRNVSGDYHVYQFLVPGNSQRRPRQ